MLRQTSLQSFGRSRCFALLPWTLLALAGVVAWACVNPFAPGIDNSPAESTCDPKTIDGIFRCFQASYTFRDTTVYGQILDDNFVFTYRDYDLGVDISWGREEDLRSTYGLFQNAQKLDLIWNNIISSTSDSNDVNVVRGFSLTIVFNPSDVEYVNGYANLLFERQRVTDPWKIVRWRDESNY
ncbi:MAG TPA: hypothetical protein VMG09_01120 [Bacteroidota bacterium]|nr:hypothetical protein [Bacteroidota bacterium]